MPQRCRIFWTSVTAASASDARNIELLVNRGADCRARAKDGSTALHCAAENITSKKGDHAAVEALIDLGADVNAIGGEYGTVLIAASANGMAESVRTLLKNGADSRYRSEHHGTAIEAARTGKERAENEGCCNEPMSMHARFEAKRRAENEGRFDEILQMLSEAAVRETTGKGKIEG